MEKVKKILKREGCDLYKYPFECIRLIESDYDLVTEATGILAKILLAKSDDERRIHTEQDRRILIMSASIDIGFLEAMLYEKPDIDERKKEGLIDDITDLTAFKNDLLERHPH